LASAANLEFVTHVRQTASGRPVAGEKLKRKDYEIATLKRQLSDERRELDEARRRLRRLGKDDPPSTVHVTHTHD